MSYLGVTLGVLAVADAFTSTDLSAGLGFGLFGVLSIIRLRSSELDQPEVAYYSAALALGVLGGVPGSPPRGDRATVDGVEHVATDNG